MVAEVFIKLKLLLLIVVPTYFVVNLLGYSFFDFIAVLFGYVVIFGLYSVGKVAGMAFNFNDCVGARKELEQQIEKAKKHLSTIGL
ncbi:hypothetical protein FO519_001517 [Halicephalobus sp. NKZ332]|nr:hypothetical protein FO519_001517 [Halicephalobus sp. NKZ332]